MAEDRTRAPTSRGAAQITGRLDETATSRRPPPSYQQTASAAARRTVTWRFVITPGR
ncbi:hypothetical protein Ssi03_13910 [Sphaerisporangium siamense]|nr:hypothetical protein Ssi03_13910 [Sphaerisporangium siamense]